jgi:catechol 2,3-dioxygenase-like lactoylglutathione lyase family enzyme
MTKYLHTMIRVSSLEDTIAFFEVLGLREISRRPDEKGRYTNVFLAAPGDEEAAVELTYIGIPSPTPAAAISAISHTPWITSTTLATPLSPTA